MNIVLLIEEQAKSIRTILQRRTVMKGFTFNDLCASLKKNSSLSENADAVKTLIGSAAVLLGDTATGNVAGFIRAVSEKDKLIDLGKIVLQNAI